MAGTSKTIAALGGTEFATGQAPGSITPLSMQDLIATLAARTPFVRASDAEYAVDATGTNDTTTGLQAAITAAAGGLLYIPSGTYKISATLIVASNTTIIGAGYSTRIMTTSGTGFNYINNTNFSATYSASTKVDKNISIAGLFFDYGSLNDGGTHAVSFRMAQNITVRDCFFNGGNDATAMLACQTTLVENCRATGLSNCAYDQWDGANDFTVRKCYATMIGGNGLLATGVDTTGVLARTTDGGLFEDCEIHGGGVGVYMNAGYTGCAVQNVTVRNIRLYGTVGGVVCDGPGGRHTIENIFWVNGGSSGSGDCAVRISIGTSPTTSAPNDCLIDKIHIVNSTTASGNTGIVQIGGLRHEIGSVSCVSAAIANGTLFYFTTNANGCVLCGPVFMDAASISGITYGLYQGGGGAFDTNTQIACWDPFNGFTRHEGVSEMFEQGLTINSNSGFVLANQTSGAAAATGTLTNAPSAGNPNFWLSVKINGTTRYIPAW